MTETTGSASASEIKTYEEGTQIKGKDFIFLDAPEINFPENAPLHNTDKRELYAILNELFQGEGGGGDWQPPAWWIPVPEPQEYEIFILVWITSINNQFVLYLVNNETGGSGFAKVSCDWGDGTGTTYPAEYYWSNINHSFKETGQYLIKITTSEKSNVVYSSDKRNCYWQIIKTGSNIRFVSDYYDENSGYGTPFLNHWGLKYIKVNNAKGLPFDKTNYYFEYGYALQKIELKKPMSGNIPNGCFRGNAFTDFQQILDGNSVNSIGDYAFADCRSLQKIILPNCTSIGNYAFMNCYNLQEIVVAEDCTFGTNCFQYCYNLFPRPDGSVI